MLNQFIAFLSILALSFSGLAQFEVKTVYSDKTPNDNCYLSTNSYEIGLTNRFGIIYIPDSLKGSVIHLEDLETGLKDTIMLNEDTVIITDRIQELEEVQIKPRDRKKLLEEIIELNQERLPKKMNIQGEFYIAAVSILNSNEESDTLIEIYKSKIIIRDVLKNPTLYIKEAVKIKNGNLENKDLIKGHHSLLTNFSLPKKLENVVKSKLNLENSMIKKYRKYNSTLISDVSKRSLLFNNSDTTKLFFDQVGKEFRYTWNKTDSSLTKISKYFQIDDSDPNKEISFPYNHQVLQRTGEDLKNGRLSSESEIVIRAPEKKRVLKNNFYYYLSIKDEMSGKKDIQGFKEVENFKEFYLDLKAKKSKKIPDPTIYPLRFPPSIFF